MTDKAIVFDPVLGIFDWAMDGPALLQDEGWSTAILISLGCDKRALPGDVLPDEQPGPFGLNRKTGGDRRGWFGDFLTDAAVELSAGAPMPAPGDRIGSWLWLYRHQKLTDDLPGKIKAAAQDALTWFIADGLATEVNITARKYDRQTVLLSIEIVPVAGTPRRFLYPAMVGGGSAALPGEPGNPDTTLLDGFILNQDLLS